MPQVSDPHPTLISVEIVGVPTEEVKPEGAVIITVGSKLSPHVLHPKNLHPNHFLPNFRIPNYLIPILVQKKLQLILQMKLLKFLLN